MPDYVVRRLMLGLNRRGRAVSGSRVLLLGVAYKPNTSDARETPATRITRLLMDMGADVVATDPHVPAENFRLPIERVELTEDELLRCDAAILLCDHDAFDFAMVERTVPYVLDCRRRLQGGATVELL
jgi:UDP-N-acetyl-D-glucosamine dehydrogenase